MGRIRATHSYRWVLAYIVLMFIWISAAPPDRWALIVLLGITSVALVLAMWTSGLGEGFRPGLILIGVAATVGVADLVVANDWLDGVTWILNFTLALGIVASVTLGIVDQGEVNRQSVTGAVCVYLLIGIVFTFVYGAVAAIGHGDFFAQGTDGTPSIRLYFSYITLATVGYGDYTADGDLGRSLAVSEALLGQLYLVTVIALLVANLGRSREKPPLGP